MLLELSCSNHKSIKEPISFSMVTKDAANRSILYRYEDPHVLKSAAIYGTNGSGKSNFVDAIYFMKNLVLNSIRYQPGQGILQKPHKLSNPDAESKYAIQFITGGIQYSFGFTLRYCLIIEEYLYCFYNGTEVKLYERDESKFTVAEGFKNKFKACNDVLKPNRLLLSCAANFSNVEEINRAFGFFRDELVIYRGLGTDNWMEYSMEQVNTNPATKKTVLSFLQSLGIGIEDVQVRVEYGNSQPSNMPLFLNTPVKKVDATVIYPKWKTDLRREESSGVQKLLELLCPVFEAISKGKVLICDDMEAGLQESVLYRLITLFEGKESKKSAQLIFTTHDAEVQDLDLLKGNQIWFTQISPDSCSTKLCSLEEMSAEVEYLCESDT